MSRRTTPSLPGFQLGKVRTEGDAVAGEVTVFGMADLKGGRFRAVKREKGVFDITLTDADGKVVQGRLELHPKGERVQFTFKKGEEGERKIKWVPPGQLKRLVERAAE